MTETDPFFYFQFEADFVETLRCIPLIVRYKLDTCGVKLKLSHWHQFSQEERSRWVTQACDTSETIDRYREDLQALIIHYTGTPASTLPIAADPPWLQADTLPPSVLEEAQRRGRSLSLDQWQTFTPLQRFALLKLSQSGHENRNFEPALDEFLA